MPSSSFSQRSGADADSTSLKVLDLPWSPIREEGSAQLSFMSIDRRVTIFWAAAATTECVSYDDRPSF